MRYILIINDEERRANGDEDPLEVVRDEVEELLRMGYFDVESVRLAGTDNDYANGHTFDRT